jgi:PAS domain S-box-containing protein
LPSLPEAHSHERWRTQRRVLVARRLRRFLERDWPTVCGVLAVGVGVVVLLGYRFDVALMRTLVHGVYPMSRAAAGLAILGGAALIFAGPSGVSSGRRLAGRVLAAGMLSGSATLLVVRLLPEGASLPRWFAEHLGRLPSSQACVTAMALATALLSLEQRTRRGKRPAELIALAAGLVPLASLLGYLFEIGVPTGAEALVPHAEMTLPTSVSLFAIASGILASRSSTGVLWVLTDEDSGGVAARALVAWLLVLGSVALALTLGAREGLFGAALASALTMLVGIVGGCAFVIRLSRRLSELAAKRRASEEALMSARDSEQRLRAELEKLGHASGAVSEVLADLPQSNLTGVLSMIALQAQSLVKADYVAVGVGADGRRPFSPWVSIGVSDAEAQHIGRPPRPVGTLGMVAREGMLVRVDDIREQAGFRGFPQGHPEMAALMGVPIQRRGRPMGNLYLARKPGARAFSEQEERIIRMLAARVGVIIETAELYNSEALQRAWLQNIIDQMPDGVLLFDHEGRLKAVNQATSSLAGEQDGQRDAFGNPVLLDLRNPDGSAVPPDAWPWTRSLVGGEPLIRQEVLLRKRDGVLVPAILSVASVRDASGKRSGSVVILQDISSQKALQRLREEWSAVVAHDLRQPVSTITMSAQLLLGQRGAEASDRERRLIERIDASAKRLNVMISDLQDASLIESARLALEPKDVALRPLVDAVVDDHQAALAERKVEIQIDAAQHVWADTDRIHQVLGNLLYNAAK